MIKVDQFREALSRDLPEIMDLPEKDIKEFIQLLELITRIEADTLTKSIDEKYAKQ